ncbi:MAG: hypothetical protein WBK20_01520 [Spirochaetota bacterium]
MKKNRIIQMITVTGFLYAIAFIITTIIFIFFSSTLINTINVLSQKIVPDLPLAQEHSQFYLILTVAMMAGVTVCSLLLYKNAEHYIEMAIPLITMKFASSVFGLLFFIYGCIYHNGWNNMANLIIFTTDFPLGLWVLYLYRLYKLQKF